MWSGSIRASYDDHRASKRIIQSSICSDQYSNTHITPSDNGFVRALFSAYSSHHHLTIRPEDVWFAMLSQINFYINAHAEELRDHFVSHEGKKELELKDAGNIGSYDFGVFARRMTSLLQENVKDPDFRDWVSALLRIAREIFLSLDLYCSDYADIQHNDRR
jgi:hypothetical protein